jgi:hypothetical protein
LVFILGIGFWVVGFFGTENIKERAMAIFFMSKVDGTLGKRGAERIPDHEVW